MQVVKEHMDIGIIPVVISSVLFVSIFLNLKNYLDYKNNELSEEKRYSNYSTIPLLVLLAIVPSILVLFGLRRHSKDNGTFDNCELLTGSFHQ